MRNWRFGGAVLAAMVLGGVGALSSASAATGPLRQVSGGSPFTGCTADGGQAGTSYAGSEIEPSVASNPNNRDVLVGAWQQDRWSNGGSRGIGIGRSVDGGQTWTTSIMAGMTLCRGGAFERATDPWVTIGPAGTTFVIAEAFNDTGAPLVSNDNAMMVSRSMDGGQTFTGPTMLTFDSSFNVFNDKVTGTADPDGQHVYVTWDRLEYPKGNSAPRSGERATGYRGPAIIARSTDNGTTWEPAKMAFDPGEINQVIGSQVLSLGGGQLIDGFNLIYNFKNAKGLRGNNVAFIRSGNYGDTWTPKAQVVDKIVPTAIVSPDSGHAVRTGDIIPDFAAVPTAGTTAAKVYAVWQDARLGGSQVLFSQSLDGGTTWSPSVQISKTPSAGGTGQAFTPTVEVGVDGSVGVTYYDFRNNTAADGIEATDQWFIRCAAACTNPASWAEQRVTDSSFDMAKAPDALGYFVGDYEGLTASSDGFLSFFSAGVSNADPASVFSRRLS